MFAFLLSCSKQPVYPEPFIKGAEAVINAGSLRPESPLFFTYPAHGKKINFFVVKTGGKVLSFLDACESCYPSRLGFRVDEGFISCRKCEVRYSLSDIEKGFGSCFPIEIKGYLSGGEYRIPVSRLQEAAEKF
jgi:uncharacterized membrane protein